MQGLARAFADAFPFVYSEFEIASPENKKSVKTYIDAIKGSAHAIPLEQGRAILGDEPFIMFFPEAMGDTLLTAAAAFDKQDFKAAQSQLKSVTHYCFACHVTHRVGPKSNRSNSEIVGLPGKIREKAIALVALRQFAAAKKLVWGELEKPTESKTPNLDLLRIYALLGIAGDDEFADLTVRIRTLKAKFPTKSPQLGILIAWESSLNSWLSEGSEPSQLLPAALLDRVAKVTSGRKDMEHFIDLIMLARQLSSTAAAGLPPESAAKYFLGLGDVYRSLHIPEFSLLPLTYLSACAKKAPQTAQARECASKAISYMLMSTGKKNLGELPEFIQKKLREVM
jgi:hypothetical protein